MTLKIRASFDPATYVKPTAVHEKPCPRCPSAHYPPDPESEEIIRWVKAGKMPASEAVFSCAWRPEKLCRGVCDNVGYSEPSQADKEVVNEKHD